MGALSRRGGDTTSVRARRMGVDVTQAEQLEPIVIQVPAGQPVPVVPSPQPGVTQNIVYIVTPPGPGGPATAPAALPPQEVHYHTTNNYAPSKRRREKGTSFFGTLAVMAGLLACACAYVPPVTGYVKPIAQTGLVFGALGLVMAILFRRAGRGLPAIGILISAIAFPIWLSETGQLQTRYDQLRTRSPVPLPAIDFSNAPGISPATINPMMPDDQSLPVSPAPGNVRITPATPPSQMVPHHGNDHSIFGDSGVWQKPDDVTTPAKPNAANRFDPSGGSTPNVDSTAGTSVPSAAMSQALDNLESARSIAARRRGLDYSGAKAAAAAAASAYQQARISYDLKSPELIDADQKKLAAASVLHDVKASLDNDPDVAAAQQAVRAVKR